MDKEEQLNKKELELQKRLENISNMEKEILTKEKGKTGEIFIENLEKVYFREASWIE